MNAKPTVFVVDDDRDARDSVCALVRSMRVPVEPFSSAEQFLRSFDEEMCGCLVSDMRMPGMGGLDLVETLWQAGHRLPIIIISGYINVPNAVSAMKKGALTVLEKPYEDQELWDAISNAMKKDVTIRMDKAHQQTISGRFARLTSNEQQVLDLIADGTANKVVARKLGISLRTVEDRRRRVYTKLGADSLAGVVKMTIDYRRNSALNPSFSAGGPSENY